MIPDFSKYENKNFAKIEFLSIKDDIAEIQSHGLSFKGLYRYFKDLKKIKMSYNTFRRYLKLYNLDKDKNKKHILQNKEYLLENNNIKELPLGSSKPSVIYPNKPNQEELTGINED